MIARQGASSGLARNKKAECVDREDETSRASQMELA
jgi:hypothetical protein